MNCPHCGTRLSASSRNKACCSACDEALPTGETCPHCGAVQERGDDGNCNRCGKAWPALETDAGREPGASQAMSIEEAQSVLSTLKKSPESESYARMLAAQEEDDARKAFIKAGRKNREALDELKGESDDEGEDRA